MSKVVYEGWMVRYGRRKIGRSYIHMRYFVLETRLLAYYKRKPQDNVVPIKTLPIDGNCRVEDRGLKTHHGHMVYVLSVYNKKDKYNRVTMAAFNIQEALIWKEKIESIIDQHQESQGTNGNKYNSFEYKSDMDNGRNASSSDHESQFSAAEDEDDSHPNLLRRTTIGRGPPESVFDWTKELDSDLANQNGNNQAFSRKYWRLLQCQNGLRIFEELLDGDLLPKSCSRAMKAVGVVEASCEDIFELVMSMDATRFEWDCSFQYGSLVEEVDGHTAILYHRLQLDWFPTLVWPRDLCYVRYWRRNDDGSYVVLFRSREHENCGPLPGYVRAHIESGGFNISPLKPLNGRPRTQVQHLMQVDLKGWGVGYISSFQQHCLLQMLNSVAGLREYFSQTDERTAAPRIPVMVNMTSASVSSKRNQKLQETPHHRTRSLDQIRAANRNASMMDEYSDEEEDFQGADQEVMPPSPEHEKKKAALEEEPLDQIDFSIFSGNLRRDDRDNGRNCWRISDGNNFRVRSKNFCYDKSKIRAGKPLMDLVAVDWFKDTKRMDHVARRPGCAAQVATEKGLFSLVVNVQVPGSTHYSMVFYFVMKELTPGSLLQRFVDGDDDFRNSRMKLIPSVPKGSWIVRQSVGSTPCILGKAVDCNYIRGPKYLEIDVDIGSSTVANGVLGLVIGVITSLVVDMAFLVQGNTPDELPEQLIGAVRASHIELSSAIVPKLESDTSQNVEEFYQQCDPEKENLCLYGFPSEQWEVNLPAEEVPPELPEPALGINFARDGMQEKDWLSLVAVHSDAWLLSVAFYFGARFGFDRADRRRLFNMINDLPTIFEVVSGTAKKQSKDKSSMSNHSSTKSKSNSKVTQRGSESQPKYSRPQPKDEDEDGLDEDDEQGETLCGACGENYASDEFWICCDICEIWFHGKCVKITPARAEHIKQYKCPSCSSNKRTRP